MSGRTFFVGIDIGGTFTDVILAEQDTRRLYASKMLTTYDDPSRGVISALQAAMDEAGAAPGSVQRVVHATTLATNLILESKGARVGYVATEGFGDLLQMGRGKRMGAARFDLFYERADPPVSRTMTIEARERLDHRGEVVTPLDEARLAADLKKLAASQPQAVAVCLMHSYANPAHEQRVGAAIKKALPEAYVALSSDVWPEFREYERATTTVMSAYVGPVMSWYVGRLEEELKRVGVPGALHIMHSSGGVMTVAAAASKPIHCVESGPAAGVIAVAHMGGLYGHKDIICFDMGGTTAKAGLVRDGKPTIAHGFQVGGKASAHRAGGFPIQIPIIDLAEVGAGGGSIAWVDMGGILQVGPRSAGSTPGPACYELGGDLPTVTDANLILGYLNPDNFLGGKMRINPELSREAIRKHVAEPLGMDVVAAASGIHEIVNANMASAVRLITVERGVDPRDFVIIASGGAGPAHVVRVAEEFDIPAVIVPMTPGLASAAGLLMSDMSTDYVRTRIMAPGSIDVDAVNAIFGELVAAGVAKMTAEGVAMANLTVERQIDARFRYQGHELSVTVGDGKLTLAELTKVQEDFREQYFQLYGVRQAAPVELVNYRVRVTGQAPKVEFVPGEMVGGDASPARTGSRPVYFKEAGGFVDTPVYDRRKLRPGDAFTGPAIVEEPDSNTIVPLPYDVKVGAYLQLEIRRSA